MSEVLTEQTVRAWGERYSNWSRWGIDDQHGTLNFITRERVLAACEIPQTGRVISCVRIFDQSPGCSGQQDDPEPVLSRCGTQWESLVQTSYDGKIYNNQDVGRVRANTIGRDPANQFNKGVLGRGVLLDLPRFRRRPWLEEHTSIGPADLDCCAEAFGVAIESGDIVLIRTGMITRCSKRNDWSDYFSEQAPGLSLQCARWIFEREVAAAATDTWSVEVRPSEVPGCSEPLHMIAQRSTGVLFGRVFDLDELADACADDGRYEFLFVTAPLPISGAVGSPINPLAIK